MRLFDWHCDTATVCESRGGSLLCNPYHWDIFRANELFEQWIQATALFVDDTLSCDDAWYYVKRMLSFVHQEMDCVSGVSQIRPTIGFDESRGGIFLGVENGSLLYNDLSRLEYLAQCGVIYITLTWNGQNPLGNGCLSSDKSGLTSFGKKAVKRMYDLGVLPDVSHLNEAGFWDVVACGEGEPVIATHSLSATVHAHPRNLSDDMFKAVRDSGGIVGLHLCENHLGEQTFEQLERHWYHFLMLDGIQTVALGMDLDGTSVRDDWRGIRVAPRFYEYLLRKGYKEKWIDELFFKNSFDFFTKTLTSNKKCIRIGT